MVPVSPRCPHIATPINPQCVFQSSWNKDRKRPRCCCMLWHRSVLLLLFDTCFHVSIWPTGWITKTRNRGSRYKWPAFGDFRSSGGREREQWCRERFDCSIYALCGGIPAEVATHPDNDGAWGGGRMLLKLGSITWRSIIRRKHPLLGILSGMFSSSS